VVLSKRERNIGIFTGAAVAILVINYAIVDPLIASKDDVVKQEEQARSLLAEKVNIRKRSMEDGPRWNEISRSGMLKEPSAAESQIYSAVSSWAREAGLNPPPALKSDRTEKYGKYFYKITIRATANGGMEQITRFLWHFQTSTIPVRINEITLSSRKDGVDDLSLQMSISTIYLAPESEVNSNKQVAMATGTEVRP
jgi:hypothetical protein